MKCANCGTENPDLYRFCGRCGAGIGDYAGSPRRQEYTRLCPSCGREINWYAAYCPYCGNGTTGSNKTFKGSLAILIVLVILFWPAAIIYYFVELK